MEFTEEQRWAAAQALWEQQNPLEAMHDHAWERLDEQLQTVAWHDANAVLHAISEEKA